MQEPFYLQKGIVSIIHIQQKIQRNDKLNRNVKSNLESDRDLRLHISQEIKNIASLLKVI